MINTNTIFKASQAPTTTTEDPFFDFGFEDEDSSISSGSTSEDSWDDWDDPFELPPCSTLVDGKQKESFSLPLYLASIPEYHPYITPT